MNDVREGIYSYFPGCSLEVANKAYDVSTRNVARVLGLQMVELDDWNCCGATAYFAVDDKRAHVLAARNLALAETRGHDLVTVCSGCYLALNKTNHCMEHQPALRDEVRSALHAGGMDYRGGVRVRHFLEVVAEDLGQEVVQQHVVRPLTGLDVACYHGCQLTRPYAEVGDAELPLAMDRLVAWLGATPVSYPLKTRCCGGMLMTTAPELGLGMTGKLLSGARQCGAACVATACPLCQVNLEAYQRRAGARVAADCSIPVLYFTQLMGWAMGLGDRELAISDSLTPVAELLARQEVMA